MTALQTLGDLAWPGLVLVLVLIALRRLPPAGLRQRLMGGILVALVGLRVLAGDTMPGPLGDPREACALLVCLGLGVLAVTKLLRLPDPF